MIDYASREINCKIVYYGPTSGGKTSNLEFLSKTVSIAEGSKLVSLNRDDDKTMFFDFLPVDFGMVRGFKTTMHLFSVPGQSLYNALRKPVLKSAHGVVFVADSDEDRIEDNLDAFQSLLDNMRNYGYESGAIPIVIQYNKRDLPSTATIQTLQDALNPGEIVTDPARQMAKPDPFHAGKYLVEQIKDGQWIERSQYIEAIAVEGKGVVDTLKVVGRLALKSLL